MIRGVGSSDSKLELVHVRYAADQGGCCKLLRPAVSAGTIGGSNVLGKPLDAITLTDHSAAIAKMTAHIRVATDAVNP